MTMLRSILVALGAAAALLAFASIGALAGGPVVRSMVGVALGVTVTGLVYGEMTFVTVAVGAMSPLAFAALDPLAHGAAAFVLCLLWLAPRFVLADSRRKLVTVIAASLVGAGVAGYVFVGYWEAPVAAHAASCVFAGSCLALVGIVVRLPTTTACALRTTAAAIDGPVRDVLTRAARAHESSQWQPRAPGDRRKWKTLVRLSDERAALERATGGEATNRRRDLEENIENAARELVEVPEQKDPSELEVVVEEPAPSAIAAPSRAPDTDVGEPASPRAADDAADAHAAAPRDA